MGILNIKNPEAYELAKELAARTGETLTDAVIVSLRQRLESKKGMRSPEEVERIMEETRKMQERMARHPVLDPRSSAEIIDDLYDEWGLPK